MSRKAEVGDYVERTIQWYADNAFLARSRLTLLQRGAGKEPGELPEVYGSVIRSMPKGFIGEGGYASKEEWACYTALTLFALHQQGKDIEKDCVHTPKYVSIGTATNRLKGTTDDANEDERLMKRIRQIVSANDISGVAWHLRSMVQMYKKAWIRVNYRILAEDLYEWQFPEGKQKVSLKWGQDYNRTVKEEEDYE